MGVNETEGLQASGFLGREDSVHGGLAKAELRGDVSAGNALGSQL